MLYIGLLEFDYGNHYDHNGNNTLYHCDYLKKEVERMLYDYKKQVMLER